MKEVHWIKELRNRELIIKRRASSDSEGRRLELLCHNDGRQVWGARLEKVGIFKRDIFLIIVKGLSPFPPFHDYQNYIQVKCTPGFSSLTPSHPQTWQPSTMLKVVGGSGIDPRSHIPGAVVLSVAQPRHLLVACTRITPDGVTECEPTDAPSDH